MILQALVPLDIRLNGEVVHYEPGAIFTATTEQATRLLERAPGKLRALTLPPFEPLQPGWLVAYQDQQGRLRGGCDERAAGTVWACEWDRKSWMVMLTNGDRLPLARVRSVGKTDETGRVIAAWTVREHDYDGEGLL